jgi:tetratricopeptide (TPR) repeat protein
MEAPMSVGWGAWKASLIVAGCLVLTLPVVHAQKNSVANSAEAARASLEAKARALEARGRPDMAAQEWQQILLSEPNNVEALAGLARDYKLMGSSDLANQTLDRLRKVSPNDPNIAKIEAMPSTQVASGQLRQAGELAQQGRVDDAMRIYRQLYGDHPPDGDIARAYYKTLYGTSTGKAEAIAGMRALAERNPGDPRYAVQLGIMLTYDQRTRAEGIRILEAHPADLDAQAGLRQALMWDSANPASAAELREFLKAHPQDRELAARLRQNEFKLAQMNSGIARTPQERAAFAALNAHRLDEAERRFTDLLEQEPDNGRMAAGMGFLRMQQKNFGGAIGYLTQAEQNGYKAKTVETALATSRFWYTMDEATQAFDRNQLDVAATKFRAALDMKPRSPEALNGLAGLYTKQQQYSTAAGVYEQLIRVQPGLLDGWRGLFIAYARDDQYAKALAVSARFPAQVNAALNKDPDYLRTLAGIYQAQNRNVEAARVLALALSLPFPDNGATLLADTKLQYAGILLEAKHYDQAVALYSQVLLNDPSNVQAWMGLISAHHELGQDSDAIGDVEKMPAAAYETALGDPGFLSMLGAIYQQANQYEVAQGLLERSEKLQIAAGGQPSVALQLQLAAIYLLRNNTDQAYAVYRQVLTGHPDRADAWKGIIDTLTVTNRNTQALDELSHIPVPVRKQLDADIDFVQTEASLYAASGDTTRALQYMNRVETYYAKLKELPPAKIDIQNAWLLYSIGNDRALYSALMHIGGRTDLTVAQREVIQDIWANWSVRRAAVAMDNGNVQRAVDILDAASQAFPNNLTVRKAVAGGYARVGRAKEAVSLFKTVPMQDASAGDFEGAIGAALAANDKNQAELWLRQALDRFPTDPAVLTLAARYEQARGDNERAADYYRASLAAMPKASPVDRLAHVLVYPEQSTKAHRAVTAADLQRLLNPDYEPFAKTSKLPPLPAYGPDPYNGGAPVVLPQTQPSQPAPQTPPSGSKGPGSETQPLSLPVPNAAVDRGPSAFGTHIVLASWHGSRPVFRGEDSFLSFGLGGLAAIQSAEPYGQVEITLNPPHSLASDTWKGLVFSLMAGDRNAEALDELSKIPPDVRRQLEADIEWVQGIASLYAAVNDIPHATYYLKRVENFYVLHRTPVPGGLEVQHAWLLYNMKDDAALYPILLSLDARPDLTPAQRQQVETLWAVWAVRRAGEAMDHGRLLRGVEILQAASQDYPDNMIVRRAVAGAYARVGRSQDALTIFKALPMDNASSGDFQGAIWAALAVTDMAQAEAWLRIALARYPNDPNILGLAARFEQARGNNERASAFWRAAIAAMPPGSSIRSLDYGLASPPGSYRAPGPGDTRRLLDPRLDPHLAPLPGAEKLAPLPSYQPQVSAPVSAATPATPMTAPSDSPLPLPSGVSSSGYAPSGQGTAPSNPPVYVPPGASRNNAPSGPVLIEQSSQQPRQLTGRVILPPSEENVASTAPDESQNPQPPSANPAAQSSPGPANLRISSQPMDATAAQAQVQFAQQTDSQLTQGSASLIHTVPNAPVGPLPTVQSASSSSQGVYNVAQYTPSAQEAATGAYSAPKQQASPQQPAATSAKPQAGSTATKHKQQKKKNQQATQTLGNAPITSNPLPEGAVPSTEAAPPQQPMETQEETPAQTTTGTGLTDQELEQRNLPPLRGPWVRVQREGNPLSPRDEAEMQLRAIESGYSGWLGGSSLLNYRTGDPGYGQLAAIEAPFEASAPLGYHARIVVVARPVFLDSGQATGNATINVLESSISGSCLVSIQEPIGTYVGAPGATSCSPPSSLSPPAQQNAVGLGGELQLVTPHLGLAGGYTPYNFLVSTETGRFQWRPGNGPFTLSAVRDAVKDSQLSYAGLRDPAGSTLGTLGQIWGGVVYNQGQIQFAHGDARSGYYFTAGGQYLTGYNVKDNTRIDGNGGAYWRAYTSPEYGNLSVGANFFAMHYDNNQYAFTYGMGGYFSPQGYFLANVPFSWAGHYETNWHYNIMGALGVQAYQEDSTPLWPLAVDKPLETSQNNPMLPNVTSVSANYDLRSQVAYQIGPRWFAGGYLSANNTRSYNFVSVGFFVRFMFREQPSTATAPTGLFPWDGLRPFTVP